jgi:hypothetical protein
LEKKWSKRGDSCWKSKNGRFDKKLKDVEERTKEAEARAVAEDELALKHSGRHWTQEPSG